MGSFTDQDWKTVLGHLADVIGPEADKYANVPAAKILAAIPYLAKSEDPDRFAVSNLLTFHGATKARALFNHRPSDNEDVLRRLATLHFGNQSDPKVVDFGLNLLALISLGDHEHDQAADARAGKYNPIAAKVWDGDQKRRDLQAELDRSPALQARFTEVADLNQANLTWWSR